MTAVLTVVVAMAVFLFSFVTLVSLDRAVAPELQQRIKLIGSVVRDNVQETISAGIPLQMVGGLDGYLGAMMDEFGEIRRITVTTTLGDVVADVTRDEKPPLLSRLGIGSFLGFSGADLRLPILVGNDLVGSIDLVSSGQFIESRLRSVLLDAAALALAVILIGVELALVVTSDSIWRPLRAILALSREQAAGRFRHTIAVTGLPVLRLVARRLNDQAEDVTRRLRAAVTAAKPDALRSPAANLLAIPALADMRLALFTFAAATEVTASFLPVYARGAERPAWLEPGLAAAAPSALYLAVMALLAPLAGRLVARFGPRRVFSAAAIPAALALAGMAVADTIAGVVMCRGAIAVCYAFATIACQDYALGLQGSDRPRVSAVLMAMVFGGTFCGSTIGGVFADRYGYGAAMALGAVMVLVAGLLGRRGLVAPATETLGAALSEATPPRPEPALSRPGVFHAFLFGIVAPMNLVTAICIWYLAPLQLSALGSSPAEIARVIMLFYLFQLVFGPLASGMAASRFGLNATIFTGAAIAAAALAGFGAAGFWSMTATVAGLGVGYGLLRGPALDFAAQQAAAVPGRLTLYRVAERAVALAGLLAAASILKYGDIDRLLLILSVLVVIGLLLFTMAMAAGRRT
ncbi:MAG: MFS transporter [Paracoccaceae bacterium]